MADSSDYEEEGVDEPNLSDEENEENEEEEENEEDDLDGYPLAPEMLAESLSLLCKTGNGLAHAYVRLDVKSKGITDISILHNFIHLRYVDISNNNIRDITVLDNLTQMLTLKADKNLLKTPAMIELPYLQQLNFAENKITEISGINHRMLELLNLNGNEIKEVTNLRPEKLNRLYQIELRGNKLQTTRGLNLPTLKKIYLGENELVKIEDLRSLGNLTTLHLRNNKLEHLDGFSDSMKNLQYLNLRKNNISQFTELNKLKCLPMLRAIVLRENPICYDDSYRIEVLVILRRLERLDQDTFMEDERQEAEERSTGKGSKDVDVKVQIYNQRLEAEAEAEGADGNIEVIQSEEDD